MIFPEANSPDGFAYSKWVERINTFWCRNAMNLFPPQSLVAVNLVPGQLRDFLKSGKGFLLLIWFQTLPGRLEDRAIQIKFN